MSLYYYFGWGMKTGRDIEKLILWIKGDAHFDRFGHIEYNDNIRHMIFETADAYGNHYTDYEYADKLMRKGNIRWEKLRG